MKANKWAPLYFIAPAFILFLIFTIFPIVYSFVLSFQTGVGSKMTFVAFDNYIRLFQDPIFWQSLKNTFWILIFHVPSMIFLAIILAVALNYHALKFKGFWRVIFYLPAVTSLVAYSILFSIMLKDNGLFNVILSKIGIAPIGWLSSTSWSKVSIIIAMTWRWVGYNMVIFLAALQGIPEDIYEAATIDGASKLRSFFSITLPNLKPVILFSTILSTINVLQLFVEPYALTNKGAPANSTMTFGLYIYKNAFSYFDFGYASALAYVVVILVAILSIIQFRITKE